MAVRIYIRQKKPIEDYRTPRALFDRYNNVYHFDLDAAASPDNHLVGKYFTKGKNALVRRWFGRVWCNPPYGDIAAWVRKAYEESLLGALVVMLLPAWIGASWYHEYVLKHGAKEDLPGRVKFGTPDGKGFSSYFSSMIVVFPRARAISV